MIPVQVPIPSDETIGHNVKIELAKQRWSGNRAAAAIGVTQGYLSRRTTGSQRFDIVDLAKIAGLLGLSTDELVRRIIKSTDSAIRGTQVRRHVLDAAL